jgi:pimeloyl-ACP methyl ester carboxylesterase
MTAAELLYEDALGAAPPDSDALGEIVLHGHRVFYRSAGRGPVIMLVHGITSTSATWAKVLPYLAERFTVIARDLLGHDESAKPRGDYSLGAYASGVRDLLIALGHERATFVGHSLGGGVAMQLAYQFPEHCDRLVLVSSGGLGREIGVLLRRPAFLGLSSCFRCSSTGSSSARAGRWDGCSAASGCSCTPTWARSYAATRRSRTARRGRRSCTRSGRSSIPGGNGWDASDRL